MAKSREEFLREMGITQDDVQHPDGTTRSQPSKSTSSARTAPRTISNEQANRPAGPKNSEQPPSPPTRKTSTTEKKPVAASPSVQQKGAPQNSREEFLRSLGIDNMQAPPPQAPENEVPRSTASQEYVKRRSAASQEANVSQMASQPHVSAQTDLYIKPNHKTATPAAPQRSQPSSVRTRVRDDNELNQASVDELKCSGNKSFEEGDYRKAIRMYSKAIELDPTNAALFSNRSAAYLQGNKQMGIDTRSMALRDAEKTVELKPEWFKGYSRLGDAMFKMERYSAAADAYEKALSLDPNNANIMHALGEARNQAGGMPKRTSSWAQPASTESPRERSQASKSAHDLLEDLRKLAAEKTPQNLFGRDYRDRELQKFREQHSSISVNCNESQNSAAGAPAQSTDSDQEQGSSIDLHAIPEEYTSRAASAYQQTLLQSFRDRKAKSQSA